MKKVSKIVPAIVLALVGIGTSIAAQSQSETTVLQQEGIVTAHAHAAMTVQTTNHGDQSPPRNVTVSTSHLGGGTGWAATAT